VGQTFLSANWVEYQSRNTQKLQTPSRIEYNAARHDDNPKEHIMPRILATSLTLLALTFFTACSGGSDHDGHGHADGEHNAFAEVSKAICVLTPTTANELKDVRGTITFTQTKSGVLVVAEVSGLKPNAKHGFHIHQWGNTSDLETGKATGGHYDPTEQADHGLPNSHEHDGETHYMAGGHAGDLGNLEADENGNAGTRVAQGVIGIANPE